MARTKQVVRRKSTPLVRLFELQNAREPRRIPSALDAQNTASTCSPLTSCPIDVLLLINEFMSINELILLVQCGDTKLTGALQRHLTKTSWFRDSFDSKMPPALFSTLQHFAALQSLEINGLDGGGWTEAMRLLPLTLQHLRFSYPYPLELFFVSYSLVGTKSDIANAEEPELLAELKQQQEDSFSVFGRFLHLETLHIGSSSMEGPFRKIRIPLSLNLKRTLRFLDSLPASLTSLRCPFLHQETIGDVVSSLPKRLADLHVAGMELTCESPKLLPPTLEAVNTVWRSPDTLPCDSFATLTNLTQLRLKVDAERLQPVFEFPHHLTDLHVETRSSLPDEFFASLPHTLAQLYYAELQTWKNKPAWTNRLRFPRALTRLTWKTTAVLNENFVISLPRTLVYLHVSEQELTPALAPMLPPALTYLCCGSALQDADISVLPRTLRTLILKWDKCTSLFAANLPRDLRRLKMTNSLQLDARLAPLLPRALIHAKFSKISLDMPDPTLDESSYKKKELGEARLVHFFKSLPPCLALRTTFTYAGANISEGPILSRETRFSFSSLESS